MHYHAGFRHGKQCPYTRKFHPGAKAPFGTTMEDAALKTKVKLSKYAEAGFETVVLWECQFDEMLKTDKDLQAFAASREDPPETLRIRTALRGERVFGKCCF